MRPVCFRNKECIEDWGQHEEGESTCFHGIDGHDVPVAFCMARWKPLVPLCFLEWALRGIMGRAAKLAL